MYTSRYVSLTTFKRDGTPVSTPVWVVQDGSRDLVWTSAGSGKVKRIRRNPRVLVAACSLRGRERGPRTETTARIVEEPQIDDLLRRKYGWQKRVLDRINRDGGDWVTIELGD